MSEGLTPSELHVSSGLLFDVVVLAGGAATRLAPLCNSMPKPMIKLCNRPLIWHCLYPWIQRGCRSFFVCVHEPHHALKYYVDGCRDFEGVTVHFVKVPELVNDVPSTTCDALRAFHKFKSQSRAHDVSQARDALVLSCDTIITNADLQPFVSNFYSSFCAASVMLWQPAPKKKKDEKEKMPKGAKPLKPMPWDFSCTALEDVADPEPADGGPPLSHHRLHLLYDADALEQGIPVNAGFTARRPNVMFCSDVVDAHVYLLRGWVLDHIMTPACDHCNLQEDVLPSLCSSQHWQVDPANQNHRAPSDKLGLEHRIPPHWMLARESASRSIGALNAAQGTLPSEWDELRVFATVYKEVNNSCADGGQFMMRIDTRDKYLAATHLMVDGLDAPTTGPIKAPTPLQRSVAPFLRHQNALTMRSETPEVVSANVSKRNFKSSATATVPKKTVYLLNSVVGENVVFGDNVHVTNSVVMDNVAVSSDCNVINSVVCSFTQLAKDVNVEDSFVAVETVNTGTYVGEVLPSSF